MRKPFPDVVERGRCQRGDRYHSDRGDPYGLFVLKAPTGAYLLVMAVDGPETRFDHVSVSVCPGVSGGQPPRLPTWEEMCWVKGLFWGPDELVIQYHPPESEYVRVGEVLHLWKPLDVEIPLPPKVCV